MFIGPLIFGFFKEVANVIIALFPYFASARLGTTWSGFLWAVPGVVALLLAIVTIAARRILRAGCVSLSVLAPEPTPSYVHGDGAVVVAPWRCGRVIGLPVTLVVWAVSPGLLVLLVLPSLGAIPVVTAPVLIVRVIPPGSSVHDVEVVMCVNCVDGFHDHFSEGSWSWGLEHISADVEGESSQEQPFDRVLLQVVLRLAG